MLTTQATKLACREVWEHARRTNPDLAFRWWSNATIAAAYGSTDAELFLIDNKGGQYGHFLSNYLREAASLTPQASISTACASTAVPESTNVSVTAKSSAAAAESKAVADIVRATDPLMLWREGLAHDNAPAARATVLLSATCVDSQGRQVGVPCVAAGVLVDKTSGVCFGPLFRKVVCVSSMLMKGNAPILSP